MGGFEINTFLLLTSEVFFLDCHSIKPREVVSVIYLDGTICQSLQCLHENSQLALALTCPEQWSGRYDRYVMNPNKTTCTTDIC